MNNRKEYQQQYYLIKKQERKIYFHKKYLLERNERLTKARKHYILNREVILANLSEKNQTFDGHYDLVHGVLEKYTKPSRWNLPCASYREFKFWADRDPVYEKLFKEWKMSGFDKNLTPVVMRTVKKKGFVVDNLHWDVKGNYSWWNEDSTVLKTLQDEVSVKQVIANEGTEEQKNIVRKQVKKRKFLKS